MRSTPSSAARAAICGLIVLLAGACRPERETQAPPAPAGAAPTGDAPAGAERSGEAVAVPRLSRQGTMLSGEYDPEDLPRTWRSPGGLIISHLERYSSGDVVDWSCLGSGFYVLALPGGPPRPLATGEAACHAIADHVSGVTVVPGGTAAYFTDAAVSRAFLWRIDFATGRAESVDTECAGLYHSTLSPDGGTLAALADCGPEGGRLHTLRPDGSGMRRVSDWEIDGPLSWSPDGTRLAATEGEHVVVIGADGGGYRALAPGLAPSWSPDGAWIAFVDPGSPDQESPFSIRVVRPDGSAGREVWVNPDRTTYQRGYGDMLEGQPVPPLVWSPDARWIAFGRAYGIGTSIWRVEVASGRLEQVTRRGG